MKKSVWLGSFLATLLCVIFVLNAGAIAQKSVFLKVDTENLRQSPKGTIIGKLNKGLKMVEVERQGKWAKVVISGWIWAPSITEEKDEALGPKHRASLIMVEYQTDADEVMNRLKTESFEEVAKAKSIHPTAPKGGDLGFFRKGDFDAKFEKAIFNTPVGETSDIVKLEFNEKTYFCIFKRIQ